MRRDRWRLGSRAFEQIAEHFGGVDIVVSNAGAAWQGRIGEVDEDILRKSFELNFYGHQRVAKAAIKIMRAQGTGGCLLFNVSSRRSILDRILARTAFQKQLCSRSCGYMRSITAPRAFAPTRSTPTASGQDC